MTNKDKPAYPSVIDRESPEGRWQIQYKGISKLEYFAGVALQGLLAADNNGEMLLESVVQMSVLAAKKLIDELDKEGDGK